MNFSFKAHIGCGGYIDYSLVVNGLNGSDQYRLMAVQIGTNNTEFKVTTPYVGWFRSQIYTLGEAEKVAIESYLKDNGLASLDEEDGDK